LNDANLWNWEERRIYIHIIKLYEKELSKFTLKAINNNNKNCHHKNKGNRRVGGMGGRSKTCGFNNSILLLVGKPYKG